MVSNASCCTTTTTTTSVNSLLTLVQHQQWEVAEQYLLRTTTLAQHPEEHGTLLRQAGGNCSTLLHSLLEQVSTIIITHQQRQQTASALTRMIKLIDLVATLDPEAIVTADDSNGTTPLHLACCLVEPVACEEIVAILLRRLQQDDNYAPNATDVTTVPPPPPLDHHHPPKQQQQQQQSRRLLFAPWNVIATNKDGMTAFHLACCNNNNVSLETLQLLIQANPAALLMCDNEGGHPILALYREIRSPDHLVRIWNKIEYVVSEYFSLTRSFPSTKKGAAAASAAVVRSSCRPQKKHYVLHGLLEVRRRYRPVRCPCYMALRFCDPECLLAPDAAGDLPLHVLLRNFPAFDHGIDMVSAMLKLAPESAQIRNHDGDLPLHIAIRNQLKFKNGTKSIIASYPDALGQHDGQGWYPFQLVAATTGDLTTTYQYLRNYPHVLLDF